jgi:DNA-binding Lrp family transcriptional regulator
MVIDNLDEQLVDALRQTPRASVVELADRLLAPRSVVALRLKLLLESRIVRVVAAMHPGFTGLDFIGHISVSTSGPVHEVAAMMSEREECALVSTTAGEFDFIAEVRVRDQMEMRHLLAQLHSHPNVIRVNTVIYTDIVKSHLEHQSFTPIEIDDVDRRILAHLEEDGRLGWKDLSLRVGKSPSAVRSRVGRILDAGIARIVVVQQGGYGGATVNAGVGLSLRDDTFVALKSIADLAEVDFVVATVGRFDAISNVRGSTPMDINRSLDRIRSLAGVAELKSWFHLRSIKEDYARRTYSVFR